MPATTLNEVRTDLVDVLETLDNVELYRHIRTDYTYPAILVGHPQTVDVRADHGMARDFVINVELAVEVVDPESSYDRLYELLDETVVVLLAGSATWDVQPATNFGEELLQDGRVISRCRLPVAVFA